MAEKESTKGARLLTKLAYAKHRGVTPGMVTRWRKDGRIALSDDGRLVDVDASDRMLAASLSPDRGGRNTVTRDRTPPTVSAEVSTGDRAHYGRVRTARESIRVKHDHVRYQREIGELVEKSRYDQALADGLGPILSRLESLATRVVAQVGDQDMQRLVQVVVDREVAEMRQDIVQAIGDLIESHTGKTKH